MVKGNFGEAEVIVDKRKILLRVDFEVLEDFEDTFDCSFEGIISIFESGKTSKIARIISMFAVDNIDPPEAHLLLAQEPAKFSAALEKIVLKVLDPMGRAGKVKPAVQTGTKRTPAKPRTKKPAQTRKKRKK